LDIGSTSQKLGIPHVIPIPDNTKLDTTIHPSTILLTALLSTALPIPISLNPFKANIFAPKRTCAGLQYARLRNSPSQQLPFPLSIDSTTPSPVKIGFAIPFATIGPCSLMLSLRAAAQIQGGAQIDVIVLDGPAQGSWLVGTTQFSSAGAATINSFFFGSRCALR